MTAEALAAIPPGLGLVLAGLVLPLTRGAARTAVLLGAPLLVLGWIWLLPEGTAPGPEWLGYALQPVGADALGRLFATVFAVMAFAGGLYALGQRRTLELSAALAYGGGAIGVAMAGDLLTLFAFWEAMAVASTAVVWSGGPGARRAGQRYVVVHLLGGALLMAGIAGHVAATGSIAFDAMAAATPATWLILAGFLVNAGAPPLSAWLPDAYPEASWSGAVFLSAFTTKAAVYALIRGFPGEDLLIVVGLVMVFYGIVYAILENDMRRILAYSIVNQVGFMVTAVGLGSELALNGAAAHAFVHILYKALLLMAAGSVLLQTGRRKCTELGGLFRSMPLTTAAAIVGALSISAFPLTSGFVAKGLITEAAAEGGHALVWYLLAAASAGVFLHAGIKFPWFVFFQRDSGLRPADPPAPMRAAMVLLAVLCVLLGVAPGLLYGLLPHPAAFAPYDAGAHVVYQLQLLLFSGLAFFLLLPLLRRTNTITLDADWFWRGLPALVAARTGPAARALTGAVRGGIGRLRLRVAAGFTRAAGSGALAEGWTTGSMALAAIVLLAAYLVLYYF